MGTNNPSAGYNSTNEFMVSGLPWVISATAEATVTRYQFDKISKHIIVKNHHASAALRVGFTENGVGGVGGNYYFIVSAGQTFEFDSRINQVFIKRDASTDVPFSMFVALVGIDATMMPLLTGSVAGVTFWNGVG